MSARVFLTGKVMKDFTPIGNEERQGISITLSCRDGKKYDYIKCAAWGELAKHITTYVNHGDAIEVVGRLKSTSYMIDERKVNTLSVVIDNVDFLSRKQEKPEQLQIMPGDGE